MKVKNILLTGDDGYNSIGTRTLIHYLKNSYKLSIAATNLQQSGVGGIINFRSLINWKEIEVDGIKGISVDGSPSDAVEVAREYFRTNFDLVISGINLGANVGGSYFTSGTIAAALRCFNLNMTKKAITMSYHTLDPDHWNRPHNISDDISSYLDYPGNVAFKLIQLAIKENFWNSSLININFPPEKSYIAKFTRPLADHRKFYAYPGSLDRKKGTYQCPINISNNELTTEFDAGAIQKGFISITPCKVNLIQDKAYQKLKHQTITID